MKPFEGIDRPCSVVLLLCLPWRLEAQGPPVISGFSPDSGWPGLVISINGENLIDVTEVTFNGVPAQLNGWMNFFVRVFVPANATTGPVTVVTPYGTCTSATPFVITEPPYDLPRNVSFSPAEGLPGTKVRFQAVGASGGTGDNNLDRVTHVAFNGLEAAFNFVGILQSVTATVPLGATTGPVTIVTPEGSVTTAGSFFVLPVTRLSGFVPDHGPAGTMVEILGDQLDQVTGAWIGNTQLAITRNNGLFAQVPAHASTGPISIDTPYSHLSSTNVFRVEHPFDLGIFGTTSDTNIPLPELLPFNIQIFNNGADLIKGVVLIDNFIRADVSLSDPWTAVGSVPSDPDLTMISASASQGTSSANGSAIRFDLGDLPGGATADVNIVLKANRSGVIYHLTRATSSSPDPDLRNNQQVFRALVGDAFGIAIRPLPNGILELSWPTAAIGWLLQSQDRLSGPHWEDWGGSIFEENGILKTLDSFSGQGRFYRLVRQ